LPRKEHTTTPKVIGYTLYTEAEAIQLESSAWFEWLASHTTFYLETPDGTFTARRELRKGAVFWYAFRRYKKKLYKAYLGKTVDITVARLREVARRLADKAGA
jgi:LuxR family maltose regulon positive regulatory protein